MTDAEVAPDAETANLRAERDRLEAELTQVRQGRRRRHVLRATAIGVLVVVAAVSFTAAVAGAWARRNFLDTDRFVSRVGPLIEDPAVQDALTFRITNQLMVLIDPQELFEEALPERGRILAVPLANAVQGFVEDRVESFVGSDRFARLWEGAARVSHQTSADILRGREGDVVSFEQGQVTLNLVPVVSSVLREISSASPEILGREIDIPDVSVDDIPPVAIARLEDALDVELDDDFGQLVVYDDSTLAAAQDGVRILDRSVYVLVPLSVVSAGLALWLSRRRRRTLLQLAGGVGLGMVLIRRVAFTAEDEIATLPPTETGERAAAVVVDAFLDPLLTFATWALVAAGVVAVVSLLTGSYPWARSLRRRTTALASSLVTAGSARASDPQTAAWVTAHHDALLVGIGVVGLLVLWTAELSWLGLLVVLALVAGLAAVVHRIATPAAPPPTDAAPTG
jgi:hypothetical protein